MGSGEFDGGSSVHWYIEHGDGEHGKGGKNGANGKDKHPKKGTGGQFVVKLNGVPQFTADTDTSVIRVEWDGPAIPAARVTTSRAMTSPKPASASKAKKASKSKSSKRR
jgi:hypothetical protein